jgi:hypothetical protein
MKQYFSFLPQILAMSENAPCIEQSLKWSSDAKELPFSWPPAGSSQHSQTEAKDFCPSSLPPKKQADYLAVSTAEGLGTLLILYRQ